MKRVRAALLGTACVLYAGGRTRSLVDESDDEAGRRPTTAHRQSPTVSIVIPARNEEHTLPVLLRSLHGQSLACEIIVVDDASLDATAAVARRCGARVIEINGPPEGWLGKPWACTIGARAATGEVLVLLDADVRLAPRALAALLSMHKRYGGLASVQPHHRPVRVYEHWSAVFNAVAVLGSGEFALGRSGKRRRRRAAFGPCLVTRRDTYLRLGGHARARTEIVEDIALANVYTRAGLPVTCRLGGSLVSFRMYPHGAKSWLQGWTKNIVAGASHAPRSTTLATAGWIAASTYVAISATTQLLIRRTPSGTLDAVAAWAITAATFDTLLRRIGTFRGWVSVLFPAGLAIFHAVFARAAVLSHSSRGVTWKGRQIHRHLDGLAPVPR